MILDKNGRNIFNDHFTLNFQRIPRKLKAITPNKTNIEFGHSGLECFKLFSRTRFYEHVGFAFLVRRVPKSDWKTDPYDLVSVEDVGNEEGNSVTSYPSKISLRRKKLAKTLKLKN